MDAQVDVILVAEFGHRGVVSRCRIDLEGGRDHGAAEFFGQLEPGFFLGRFMAETLHAHRGDLHAGVLECLGDGIKRAFVVEIGMHAAEFGSGQADSLDLGNQIRKRLEFPETPGLNTKQFRNIKHESNPF